MKGLTAPSIKTCSGVQLTAKNVDVNLQLLGLIHQLRTRSRIRKPQVCGFFVWWRWGESVTCLLFVTRLVFFFLLHRVIAVFSLVTNKSIRPRLLRFAQSGIRLPQSEKNIQQMLDIFFLVEMGGVEPPC